jgi:hypothetical protein
MNAEKLTVFLSDDDQEHEIPSKFAVCPRCRGKGSHVNPAVDGNGLTQEDFDEDPDFRENYFAGVYDVACHECNGKRVVLVPDRDKLTKEERAAWYEQQRDLAEMAATEAAERRLGA